MLRALAQVGVVTLNVLIWAWFILSAVIFFLVAVVLRLVTWPFDPNLKILHQFSCFWAATYIWTNPFWSLSRRGLENAERGKSYVIVANHKSWADILVVFGTFLHFKWVSKKSVFNAPLLGWNMRLNGYIPIDRGSDVSREKCMDLCREWLARGSSVFFFPEGTRSKDPDKMLPFKVGAFRLAVESGHDVLPLVIRGSIDAIPKNSWLLHRKSKMSVEVLPPVSVESFRGNPSGVESLMNHVRIQMTRKLS
jgi:1-acyl-sn-glycerol-3-phosphate acyltransferase